MKKKRILAVNPPIDQFVEQDFPVTKNSYSSSRNKVAVIEYNQGHRSFTCSFFSIEVVKDFRGHISYILVGKCFDDGSRDVCIMRTDDFNRAYSLKNKLDELASGLKPSEGQLMPCYGSLQREAFPWEEFKND